MYNRGANCQKPIETTPKPQAVYRSFYGFCTDACTNKGRNLRAWLFARLHSLRIGII